MWVLKTTVVVQLPLQHNPLPSQLRQSITKDTQTWRLCIYQYSDRWMLITVDYAAGGLRSSKSSGGLCLFMYDLFIIFSLFNVKLPLKVGGDRGGIHCRHYSGTRVHMRLNLTANTVSGA